MTSLHFLCRPRCISIYLLTQWDVSDIQYIPRNMHFVPALDYFYCGLIVKKQHRMVEMQFPSNSYFDVHVNKW